MKDMNKKLEMKLKDAREMKLLRKITTNSERQMAAICKGAQNQWFGVIEACKHSIYVNNLNLRTSIKELRDHFASCGTITIVEFCRDTVNCRFIGMNSARIEFIDISAKLKAMDLTGTILKGNKIDVTNVPAPIARFRSNHLCYRWFNNHQY
ncbi:RNA recognition motif family protein [Acanthocheilonema viteae]